MKKAIKIISELTKNIKAVLLLIAVSFLLTNTSCNFLKNHDEEDGIENAIQDDGKPKATDSLILQTPIASFTKHYFSNFTDMDSFVMEMPAGNAIKNHIYVKIYSPQNDLIFLDSIPGNSFFEDEVYSQGGLDSKVALTDLRRGIEGIFSSENFSRSYADGPVKNAKGKQIKDRDAWTEATANPEGVLFYYYDNVKGDTYVAYSYKMKKPVIIVQIAPDDNL